MKFLVLFSIFICAAFAALDEMEQWQNFKIKYGKSYSNIQEEETRFSIFKENLKKIEEHNRLYKEGKETYGVGVNKFADYSEEDFLAGPVCHLSSLRYPDSGLVYEKPMNVTIPDSLDWRDHGAVSPVKNQNEYLTNCGSCWTFSVTGTLESFNYIKNKEMVTFSEQQLIDCDKVDQGCAGGDPYTALEYIKIDGIQSEESYPYEGENNTCRYNKSAVYMKISDYMKIKEGDEDAMLTAVATKGPISVAFDAKHLFAQTSHIMYTTTGIYSSSTCSKNDTDHAALIVGYGFDENSGLDYWLVKNSWGKEWGDNGYFKIKRGSNECAIATQAVFPVL